MKFYLSDMFAATVAIALWMTSRQTAVPLATLLAALFSVLAVYRMSWLSLTAIVGSLESVLYFPTCACGHLASWPALWITSSCCVVSWVGVRYSSNHGAAKTIVSVAVALMATCVLVFNLQDLLFLGHHPVWPDTAISRSTLPSKISTLFLLLMLASFAIPLAVGVTRVYGWVRTRLTT